MKVSVVESAGNVELAAVEFLDDITLDCEDELERDDLRSTSQEGQHVKAAALAVQGRFTESARWVQRPLSLRPDAARLRTISPRHAGAWR